MTSLSKVLTVCAAGSASLLGLLASAPVRAHINMEGEIVGRDGNQKSRPCEGKPRDGSPIYTFEPGATIKLAVDEYVPHDGYFRISFDDDGEDAFVDPQSIDPINADRYGAGKKCLGDATDKCGESDYCSFYSDDGGPSVLWDQLNHHIPKKSLLGLPAAAKWSWNVKLPDVECDNCTLQVMQVMEDPAAGTHGPFDGKADLYYRCIDIVLKKGAGKTPGTTDEPVANEGMQCNALGGGAPEPTDDDAATDEPNQTAADASTGSTRGDDGVDSDDDGDDTASGHEGHDDSEDDTATGAKKDAGKTNTGAKKDAGSKSDADDDAEPASSSDEGGCSLAQSGQSAQGGAWLLLAVGACFVRGRNKRAG